jgi:hypothetical protein
MVLYSDVMDPLHFIYLHLCYNLEITGSDLTPCCAHILKWSRYLYIIYTKIYMYNSDCFASWDLSSIEQFVSQLCVHCCRPTLLKMTWFSSLNIFVCSYM